ncbi:hypothetical protein JCM5296_006150 [Sporobolomyces johnsonii]
MPASTEDGYASDQSDLTALSDLDPAQSPPSPHPPIPHPPAIHRPTRTRSTPTRTLPSAPSQTTRHPPSPVTSRPRAERCKSRQEAPRKATKPQERHSQRGTPARTLTSQVQEVQRARQTRSKGPAEALELPWGWQGMGALLGKERKVQAKARAAQARVRASKLEAKLAAMRKKKMQKRRQRHKEQAAQAKRRPSSDDKAPVVPKSAPPPSSAPSNLVPPLAKPSPIPSAPAPVAHPFPSSLSHHPTTFSSSGRATKAPKRFREEQAAILETDQPKKRRAQGKRAQGSDALGGRGGPSQLLAGTSGPAHAVPPRPQPATHGGTASIAPRPTPVTAIDPVDSQPQPPPPPSAPRIPPLASLDLPRTVPPLASHAFAYPGYPQPLYPPSQPQPHPRPQPRPAPTSPLFFSPKDLQHLPPLPSFLSPSASLKNPKKPSLPKPAKPPARHPALDSQTNWVKPERDLQIRANGKPPIWCMGRQELCESLEYFKSYQGGHYDFQERCLGYLLDGFPSANDRCEKQGRIIISHGGGCSSLSSTGSYELHASQTRDNVRMRALKNCMEARTPVVLLAGSNWDFFPRLGRMGAELDGEDGVRYAVLGCYFVTAIWAEGEPVASPPSSVPSTSTSSEPERVNYHVRFKVRFEWVESQGRPWFADVIGKDGATTSRSPSSASSPPPSISTRASSVVDVDVHDDGSLPKSQPDATEDVEVRCSTCGAWHRAIYHESISCYDEKCPNFFLLYDGTMPSPSHLTYRPSLLSPFPSLPTSSLIPQPLMPKTLQSLAGSRSISDYSKESWRGFGCTACGRLSSRAEWDRLACANARCGAAVGARGRVFGANELREELEREERARKGGNGKGKGKGKGKGRASEGDQLCPAYAAEGLRVVPFFVRGYEGYTVELGEGSRVHHLWPADEPGYVEADRLFEEYQGDEAGRLFRRNPLTFHRAQGSLLCQQFTQNAGSLYHHAIGAQTYPFSSDPSLQCPAADGKPVIPAPACAEEACEFLKRVVPLAVGEGKETGFNEILSVAYMTGGKMNYHDDGEKGLGPIVASVSLGADAIMSFRPKAKKTRGSKKKVVVPPVVPVPAGPATDEAATAATKKPLAVLKLRLRHGHVMIMEGAEMQKAFEHMVEPEGLRFAATARVVGPGHFREHGNHVPTALASQRANSNAPLSVLPALPAPFLGALPPLPTASACLSPASVAQSSNYAAPHSHPPHTDSYSSVTPARSPMQQSSEPFAHQQPRYVPFSASSAMQRPAPASLIPQATQSVRPAPSLPRYTSVASSGITGPHSTVPSSTTSAPPVTSAQSALRELFALRSFRKGPPSVVAVSTASRASSKSPSLSGATSLP